MLPDNSQGQITNPATLPPPMGAVPPTPLQPQASVPAPAAQPPAGSAASTAIAQAKQLVAQYQTNPYQLSGALQQLKAQYLAEQFHIISNPDQK